MTNLRKSRTQGQANERLLRALLDSPAVGVAVTDPEFRWVEVNAQACAMHGYRRDELVGRAWIELTHPGDVERDLAQFARLTAGEIDGFVIDKRFVRKDGSVLWANASVNCVRRRDGTILQVVAVLRDVGPRKRAEEDLRESEARLARVLDGSSDGFGDFRAATRTVTMTPRYCEIYGLAADVKEVPVEALMAVVEPSDLPPILADMEAIRTGERDSHVWEFRIRRADGAVRWLQSRGKVVGRDASGAPVHVSGATTDITERKSVTEERERLVSELRAALEQVKTLSGIVPICSSCKKIRDDHGYWEQVEAYVSRYTEARFSHSICPDCLARHFPGV